MSQLVGVAVYVKVGLSVAATEADACHVIRQSSLVLVVKPTCHQAAAHLHSHIRRSAVCQRLLAALTKVDLLALVPDVSLKSAGPAAIVVV